MSFRELILNNFWWKVAALLLAVGAYFALARPGEFRMPGPGGPYSTREMVAHPVTVSKPASDAREFKVTPSEVDITLGSNDEKLLHKLDGREVRATVDLGSVAGTTNSVPIRVFAPQGVTVEHLVPETVAVELLKR